VSFNAFLFSTAVTLAIQSVFAMQVKSNHIALAERYINDGAHNCTRAAYIKKQSNADANSAAKNLYNQAARNLSEAFQQLLDAHENGHKTAFILAKQVFEVMQKIEGVKLAYLRFGTISLSPEIATSLVRFRNYRETPEEISWQEFAHESCDSQFYADYTRLMKNLRNYDTLLK